MSVQPALHSRRDAFLMLLLISIISLTACDANSVQSPTATTVLAPQDFSVTYEWQAGTMPPPHHYEYEITIGPDAQGQIVFHPDYPSQRVPTWREDFAITHEQLRSLYELIVTRKMLRNSWQTEEVRRIGGELERGVIRASLKEYSIPSGLEGKDLADAQVLYAKVKELVPKATWDKLMAQRDEYVQNYKPEN